VNWVDFLLLSVVGISILGGLKGGFARVGIGFAAAILGIFFGVWCYGIVGAYFLDYVSSHALASLLGFGVIFLSAVLAGGIVGHLVAKFFKWAGLTWFDRLLGGAFGALRGAVVAIALATMLLAFAPSPPPKSVTDSKLLPYFAGFSDLMAALTPHEVKDAFQSTKEKAEKAWAEKARLHPEPPRHE
jgi:membrane protein required for colicin V production